MKNLNSMNNLEKARLLFQFLPNEAPDTVDFMDQYCKNIMGLNEAPANWPGLIAFGWWQWQCEDLLHVIHETKKFTSAKLYERLFEGSLALVARHCLEVYANSEEATNRFRGALALLYDIKINDLQLN